MMPRMARVLAFLVLGMSSIVLLSLVSPCIQHQHGTEPERFRCGSINCHSSWLHVWESVPVSSATQAIVSHYVIC